MIYADYAATTPVLPDVTKAMLPCFSEDYGNPSSSHQKGREAARLLASSREKIASTLGCRPSEIYFTSCGSEGDNWAVKGAALAGRKKGRTHIVTTQIEHPAVLNACLALEKQGFAVTYLGVDQEGRVRLSDVEAAVTENTALVAVMFANNEIGTIEPIVEIADIAHQKGALFFTDAVQAVGNIPIDLSEVPIDMLSLSGHKLHAPKGIGVLYIRDGVYIENLIDGGGQEQGFRSGTENLPYIVGLARAMEIAQERLPDMERVRRMRDRLIEGLSEIPDSRLNGPTEDRVPGNVNFGFAGVDNASLALHLDLAGICVSSGSACHSGAATPSAVLLAADTPIDYALGSIRISISHETREEEIETIITEVKRIVKLLRQKA